MNSKQHAATLAANGRFDAALRLLVGLDGDDAALVAFRRGALALKRNDAFAAVAGFEAVMTLDPDFPALRDALVSAYRRDARYDDAIALAGAGPQTRQIRYECGMAHLALGQGGEALACFDAILAADPDHAVSWFASHAAALELYGLEDALARLDRACACQGANGRYRAFAVAYGLLTGGDVAAMEAAHIAGFPARRPLVDGVRALAPFLPRPPCLFGMSASTLDFALDQATVPGLVLEFGVRRGTSLNRLAARAGQGVHGFDSFEGLPQSWGAEPAGVLTTGAQLPKVADNVTLHPGWFDDTLAPFLADQDGAVRLVNIDSDIYASARQVLFALAPRLKAGSIIVFDELIGNRTWAEDEFKALLEFIQAFDTEVEILAVSPFSKQVVMRVLTLRR
ncbi:class I SAM-dependent methyltransferase [Magnetospirillum gryphiswaldense]|uniref:TPR repeat n=1 Tax=Magnetospirillum gryphiswaldense TaxID=55518 RepID=A4TV06_9PROT|nr:class I SAM-dependent methyltransferase [Magnetospirillum gryphiswaldense]AVM74528.1 Macrocin-O-methyltransferase (TylF) [Magnetospirillum gryphiswaldense MSR-1]AVM78431.1 Macrocin-O-methyltransferase (TylF) [Magnetospirillum gryphiswaldense]CAM74463.1 TPR repeat [Magnetospirillum gryphiswaldense MSR-1]